MLRMRSPEKPPLTQSECSTTPVSTRLDRLFLRLKSVDCCTRYRCEERLTSHGPRQRGGPRIPEIPGPSECCAELPARRPGASRSGTCLCAAGRQDKGAHGLSGFFAHWKDAGPDTPILIAAKADYSKLH